MTQLSYRGIRDRNSVRPSVGLSVSVTRLLCDKMKEHTAHILIPYEIESI